MSERIIWHVDVPPNTTVHVESSSQEVETCIAPTPEHDGKLPSGDTYKVYYDGKGKDTLVCVQGTYTLSDHEVILEPKQALSLLDWLTQEKSKLEALAKEQS